MLKIKGQIAVLMVFFSAPAFAQTAQPSEQQDMAVSSSAAKAVPYYLSLAQDLNQYYLYANGGWSGSWYVGYNNCWIVKLPPAPPGYARAFVGAKLGRAKTAPLEDKPWEKKPLEGKIFMGLSQTPSFSSKQTYILAENKDIPLEAGPKETLEGAGSSQWFWVEVPITSVSQERPNYLALWSSAENFIDSSKSPIVAGGKSLGGGVWVNRSIKGLPPRDSRTALETPINGLSPAMVIKLTPNQKLNVIIRAVGAKDNPKDVMVRFSVIGQDIRAGWIELSYEGFNWQRITGYSFQPPYSFTIDKSKLPASNNYSLRAVAVDTLENVGYNKEPIIPAAMR
ncbi:MAG: hypothetical protein NTW04_06330 [Elusimicrobia bacterium]|nr:hypothetical protein [Elusimicrobiota bacterium]